MKNAEHKASSWVTTLMHRRRGAPDHTSQCSRKAVSDVDRRSTWLTESSPLDRPPVLGFADGLHAQREIHLAVPHEGLLRHAKPAKQMAVP